MHNFRAGLFAGVMACVIAVPAFAADPSAAGLWQIVEDGKVEGWALIVDHNGVFEGALAKVFPDPTKEPLETCVKCKDERKGQPLLGLSFIRDMKREGLKYEGGNILHIEKGSVWKAKMTLSPDGQTLTLRGYLGISLLGEDRVWTRLPDSQLAQVDPAVIAKYLPQQAQAVQPVRAPAPKMKASLPAPTTPR